MSLDIELNRIYEILCNEYGPQHWWPGDTRFEIMIGAILTQNTSWRNVEKAISNLRAADCLDFGRMQVMDRAGLAEMIRPAGYFNVKAARIKNFLEWIGNYCGGDIDLLDEVDTQTLKEQLLAVKGIGLETADSILLYALERPVFVVDTYTARIMTRHGLIEAGADYIQLQDLFEANLAEDVNMFNEFHALLVRIGKDFCRPKARCQGCPLNCLPHEI